MNSLKKFHNHTIVKRLYLKGQKYSYAKRLYLQNSADTTILHKKYNLNLSIIWVVTQYTVHGRV